MAPRCRLRAMRVPICSRSRKKWQANKEWTGVSWPLNAEVRDIAQSVVKAVGEIGGADHQRQFHDLPLVVELPQLFERSAANGGGAARDALGVQDGSLILLVKKRAALIELQCLDLLVGESDSLRRSDVRARSILAAV